MARRVPGNGSVATPKVAMKFTSAAVKAVDTGVISGSTILMFFLNRSGKKFNQQASANRMEALATAQSLVNKGCVPI
jgi:hypothetical protein